MGSNVMVGTAVERTVTELRSRILTGVLPAGARLNQRELARALGVSRIPVREALRALASERLVTIRVRSGALVAPLTTSDLRELYELRMAVEPTVCRIGLSAVGRPETLRMRRWLRTMEETASVDGWLEANAGFHELIFAGAGRPRMVDLCRQLRQQTDRYLRVHLSGIEGREHLGAEHGMILEAVERGDGTAVEALVKAHLSTTYDRIFTHLLEEEALDGGDGGGSPMADRA